MEALALRRRGGTHHADGETNWQGRIQVWSEQRLCLQSDPDWMHPEARRGIPGG